MNYHNSKTISYINDQRCIFLIGSRFSLSIVFFYVVFMIGKACGNHLENSYAGKRTSRMIRIKLLKMLQNKPYTIIYRVKL